MDGEEISRIAEDVFLARDLINTPANDMGPGELADAARALAKKHGAKFRVVTGAALANELSADPCGGRRARPRAPRLIDLVWGNREGAQGDAGRQGRLFRHRRL